MKVLQLLPTLAMGDAIGNDVRALDKVIRGMGYQTGIYAEVIDGRLPEGTAQQVEKMPRLSGEDVILYHMSTGSELNFSLEKYPCRKLMVFHNITPPRFFKGYNFWTLIWNTMAISLYSLVVGTVVPILFSVLINYVRHKRWKKTLQMVTYLPYFISNVVLVGMLAIFLGDSGLINALLQRLGLEAIPFLSSGKLFRSVYTWSGVWQGLGYSSVIYIAALSGVDPQIHEAAIVDGASIWRRIWHIDLAELRPTVLVLFIMSLGNVINVGYEKVLLMQNSLNTSTSEVLSTYVYKIGLINSDYGFSTAVGLFNSLVSMVLLLVANRVAKKLAGYSIW